MKNIIGQWANASNGTLRLELSKYALIGGTADNAPRFYQIPLDIDGAIPAGYEIWCNDELLPEGTTYRRFVFDSFGYMLFAPEQTWICGTAPISLTPDTTKAPPSPIPVPPGGVSVSISPSSVTLNPGQTQQFTAIVKNAIDQTVTWSATLGTIDAAGIYTAPSVSVTTMVTIRAISVADPTKSATASVSVQPAAGITVSISPGSATLQPGETRQFTATVTNTTNQTVTWSASLGTITVGGLYTAPSVTSATTVTITATSVANPAAHASVSVSVQPVAAISVTIAPTGGTLQENQLLQFSAIVNNSINQNVTWHATIGLIDTTGLYIAPSIISVAETATITATAVADTTKSASVNISLQPPIGPTQIDLLTWMTLDSRATQHLAGDPSAPYEVQYLDTDAGYPANYPKGVGWFIKNKLGNPWDLFRYDSTYALSHWITENGDAPYQAQCQAANGTSCWLYARAYKRNTTTGGIHIMPRFFTPGDTHIIDNPTPNYVVRTADCESTSDQINLGPVRGITTGPFKISWGGSIDHGSGTLATAPNYDNVNGVDTIKNQYMFSGNPTSGFADVEETYYVKGFGRVGWYSYHNGAFVQKTVNTTLASGGHPVPNFPCGPGKPWFV